MKTFHTLLLNNLVASTANSFLWFALVFWVYLQTRSVIVSAVVGAGYPLLLSVSSIVFGTFIDHHKKKTAMLLSSYLSLGFFSAATVLFYSANIATQISLLNPLFILFLVLIMAGAVAGNLRMITLSTLVTLLVPEKKHDKANGLVGTVNGVSFAITSIFSGLAIAYLGMGLSLVVGVVVTFFVIVHLLSVQFKDSSRRLGDEPIKKVDFIGSYKATRQVPGLLGLIFFSMINNFLGGVFFALMDPYGLELVSVQTWGFIWGGLSFAFIIGGLVVAKIGLGKRPLRRLFLSNIVMWTIAIIFPLQASIMLLVAGLFLYMLLVPMVEAAEQTVLQKVVPFAKQGRVFGFAQALESLASPFMALFIGPVTQIIFIPFMTTGRGVELIGWWFGTGVNRGIGLVFILASIVGLLATVIAFNSKIYVVLADHYAKGKRLK